MRKFPSVQNATKSLLGKIQDCSKLFLRIDTLFTFLLFRRSTLKRHMIIHDPNRVDSCAVCEQCGKLIKGNMRVHLEVHTDARPFTCEVIS
jgi:hypothetical protein